MAALVLLFLKFPLHVKRGSQWQIQVLKKGGVGLGLRRVGPTPNTGQKRKSKDKYCFHLSILIAWIMQGIGCMVGGEGIL